VSPITPAPGRTVTPAAITLQLDLPARPAIDPQGRCSPPTTRSPRCTGGGRMTLSWLGALAAGCVRFLRSEFWPAPPPRAVLPADPVRISGHSGHPAARTRKAGALYPRKNRGKVPPPPGQDPPKPASLHKKRAPAGVAGHGTQDSGSSAPEIPANRTIRSDIRGEFPVAGEFSEIIPDKSPSRENSPP
jgi:hypothetical protein